MYRRYKGSPSSITASSCNSTDGIMPKSHGGDSRARDVNSSIILQKGYLVVKKKLLKSDVKRFYFIMKNNPRLYCFLTEQYYKNWITSDSYFKGSKDGDGVVEPLYVCTVIRADRSASDRFSDAYAITILEGQAANFATHKLTAPSRIVCDAWLEALRMIQLQGREKGLGQTALLKKTHEESTLLTQSNSVPSQPSTPHSSLGQDESSSNRQSSNSSLRNINVEKSCPKSNSVDNIRTKGIDTSDSNVVLFIPGEISTLTISDSKLLAVKKELQDYLDRGHRRPSRKGLDAVTRASTKWRYGAPDFLLYDLTFIKGKTRNDQETPLESYIESCCHTFFLDAMHKCHYKDWVSVHQQYFYIQVNDGEKIPGNAIGEQGMFGLLYVNGTSPINGLQSRCTQSILSAAFMNGFPMEVVEVYSQPPRCHFSWRQWGPFTGRYKGVKGDGRILEIRGFGYVEIDDHRMIFLRVYYKLENLFKAMDQAAKALGA